MREEYDFSNATRNPYAERIRNEGMTITEQSADGSIRTRHYPPGTWPTGVKSVHVYAAKSVWVVRKEGSSRAFRRFKSEEDATEAGKDLARRSGADLVVHFFRSKGRKERVA